MDTARRHSSYFIINAEVFISDPHMKSHIKHYELLGDANLLNQLLLHRLCNETGIRRNESTLGLIRAF